MLTQKYTDASTAEWRPNSFLAQNPLLELAEPSPEPAAAAVAPMPVDAPVPFLLAAWGLDGGREVTTVFPEPASDLPADDGYLDVGEESEPDSGPDSQLASPPTSPTADESFAGFRDADGLASPRGRLSPAGNDALHSGFDGADAAGPARESSQRELEDETFGGFETTAAEASRADGKGKGKRKDEGAGKEAARRESFKGFQNVDGGSDGSPPPPPYEEFADGFEAVRAEWWTSSSRADATSRLQKVGADGSFLVRPSTEASSGNVLSVLESGRVRHYDVALARDQYVPLA